MSQEQGKIGRPKKELDWKQFVELCKMQCTQDEIAGFFHMTRDTLNERLKDATGETFSTLYGELSQGGKVSLRRAQWKTAISNESVQMQIWLGKQMLNQSDKVETELTDKVEKKLIIKRARD